jgi:hypothetical protein
VTDPVDRRRVIGALVEEERRSRLARGIPVLDDAALAAGVEDAVARAERTEPRFLHHAAARLRAEAGGQRLTCCRLVRGSHGGTYVFDPEGTDQPPAWWSFEVAMRARRLPARRAAGDPVAGGLQEAERAREAVVAILGRLRERESPVVAPGGGDAASVGDDTTAPRLAGRQVRRRLALG